MSKVFEINNYKTEEEAKALLTARVKSIEGDYLVFYTPTKEDEEDEDEGLILAETEGSPHRDEYNLNTNIVLMCGKDCKRISEGMTVVVNPFAASSFTPMVIGDIMFHLVPEKAVIAVLND